MRWWNKYRLSRAYRSVFKSEEGRVVLADLAAHSGYYKVTEPGAETSLVQYNEGMRATFNRIFEFLSMTHEEVRVLAEQERQRIIDQQKEPTDEYD